MSKLGTITLRAFYVSVGLVLLPCMTSAHMAPFGPVC